MPAPGEVEERVADDNTTREELRRQRETYREEPDQGSAGHA
jgi:hypothetical protein